MGKRAYAHVKAQQIIKKMSRDRCEICGRVSKRKARGHHVVEYTFGGAPTAENMMTLCRECHADYHAGRLKLNIVRY